MKVNTIGKVYKVDELVEGMSANGMPWSKQTVVIATESGKMLAVEFFGDRRTQKTKILKAGELVDIEWSPVSEEYHGRWYSRLTGWGFTRLERLRDPELETPAPPTLPPAQAQLPLDEEPPF